MNVKTELLDAMADYDETEEDILFIAGKVDSDTELIESEFTVWSRLRVYYPVIDRDSPWPYVMSVSRDPDGIPIRCVAERNDGEVSR